MRVLLAPDHFGGTLSATQAVAALSEGWRRHGHDDVVGRAMSDGSVGLVDVVHAARGGAVVPLVAPGPLGGTVPASVLHVPGRGGGTAYLEAGQALGAPGRDGRGLDLARHGSSAGAGHLLLAALGTGARRVVVGVGQVSTHDGGAGFLRALHEGLLHRPAPDETWRGIPDLRAALDGTDLLVAAATDIPLLGLHGAGAALAGRAGVGPAAAQDVEAATASFVAAAEAVVAAMPRSRPMLLGEQEATGSRRPSRTDRSGAGGGLAFALSLLGARLLTGAEVVAGEVGLREVVASADLVVTGGAALDGDALHDGVVATVGRLAMEHGLPVVAVAHEVHVNRRELAQIGVSGAYPVTDTRLARSAGDTRAEVLPADALAARAARIARTWSP